MRATLLAAGAVFLVAAGAHALRYLLLLINRTILLPPLVANGALLMGVLVSLAAIAAVAAVAAVATSWLIGRRAAVYRRHGMPDPRPEWALWAGCVIPVVNLVWAPVFVTELAEAEQARQRLRGPITLWWVGWVLATLVSFWATWTSGATEPQGVADNTVTEIIAYLAGLAVLVLMWRVFDGFDSRPVERPAHRWVVVPTDGADGSGAAGAEESGSTGRDGGDHDPGESASHVESGDREPAA